MGWGRLGGVLLQNLDIFHGVRNATSLYRIVYMFQTGSMLVEDLKPSPLADLNIYRSRKWKLRVVNHSPDMHTRTNTKHKGISWSQVLQSISLYPQLTTVYAKQEVSGGCMARVQATWVSSESLLKQGKPEIVIINTEGGRKWFSTWNSEGLQGKKSNKANTHTLISDRNDSQKCTMGSLMGTGASQSIWH